MLTNNPCARLRGVHFKAGPFMLQLLKYEAAGGTTLDLHHNQVGKPTSQFLRARSKPSTPHSCRAVQAWVNIERDWPAAGLVPNTKCHKIPALDSSISGLSLVFDAVGPTRLR